MSDEDKWFEEYTDRMMLQHLLLLEDHLLDYVREPSDQCQACMFWHTVKIRSYASLECVKFSEGGHKEVCIAISPFMDEIEAEMDKGLSKEKSLELAKGVREWRYKIAEFQGEDSQIDEVVMSNPGIGEALGTGAGIGAGLVVAQKVLEKDKGNGGSNPHNPIGLSDEIPNPQKGDKYLIVKRVDGKIVFALWLKTYREAKKWLDEPVVEHSPNPHNPIALSVCEKEHGLGPKLERCMIKLEERNIEKGCPPMGLGTKECPNPVAVCRASISQPVCSAKAESPKA